MVWSMERMHIPRAVGEYIVNIDQTGEKKKKPPGGSPFFQWTEVSFDLSIMARFLWRLVFNLLNLTFSNPKNPIFTEIGGGDDC